MRSEKVIMGERSPSMKHIVTSKEHKKMYIKENRPMKRENRGNGV